MGTYITKYYYYVHCCFILQSYLSVTVKVLLRMRLVQLCAAELACLNSFQNLTNPPR